MQSALSEFVQGSCGSTW